MALGCLAGLAVLALAGCSGGTSASTNSIASGTASPNSSPAVGAQMAGPAVDVYIPQSVVNARPRPWNLTTPQSAVRSYLDWVSYADRTAASEVATPTMGASEAVRVDSYIQYNLQKQRLIDQTLESITLGAPSSGSTSTLVPATERWTYSYISSAKGNNNLGGPYTAVYDSTYTVVKSKNGDWVVESVNVTAKGTVK